MLEKTDLGGHIMPGPSVCHVFRGNEPEPLGELRSAALIPFVFFLFGAVRDFELSISCEVSLTPRQFQSYHQEESLLTKRVL
jgi:hypothetical protein